MSYKFPKTVRLRKRHQFKRMAHNSSRLFGQIIIIECRSNQSSNTRLGITVTKRFGDAHERNRFKRLVREAFRLSYQKLPKGFDLNVKPRTAAKEASCQALMEELLSLLQPFCG